MITLLECLTVILGNIIIMFVVAFSISTLTSGVLLYI